MVGSRCDKQGDMSFTNNSHLPEQDNRWSMVEKNAALFDIF